MYCPGFALIFHDNLDPSQCGYPDNMELDRNPFGWRRWIDVRAEHTDSPTVGTGWERGTCW